MILCISDSFLNIAIILHGYHLYGGVLLLRVTLSKLPRKAVGREVCFFVDSKTSLSGQTLLNS